jgi:hypothetical protein
MIENLMIDKKDDGVCYLYFGLCTVVYHDARMKKKIPCFSKNLTGHFKHIIRHDIKFFGKKIFFPLKIWVLKV